jgi:hypothetical protein
MKAERMYWGRRPKAAVKEASKPPRAETSRIGDTKDDYLRGRAANSISPAGHNVSARKK